MIKIILDYDNIGKHPDINRVWLEPTLKGGNRPIFYSDYSHIHYELVEVLHKWLEEHHIQYSLDGIDSKNMIIFEKESDAILFKLVWF